MRTDHVIRHDLQGNLREQSKRRCHLRAGRTVSPTTDHTTTITKGVDTNGNEITKEASYWRAASATAP